LESYIQKINELALQIDSTEDIKELMGTEGMIRQTYYSAFDLIINDFVMELRTKQPPQNEVNALISFGNMMCYSETLRAIHQTQLNPTISYLHSPGERRYSLSLDISEIFKPIIVDRVIFKVLNKKMIQPQHFDRKLNSCLLNQAGKKIFVQAMEDRFKETIMHKSLNRKVSYKFLIRLECLKLVKDLIDDESYQPFKMYW
jgi:CRISPR-associated protein Cas1